jgi:hypothetical protein
MNRPANRDRMVPGAARATAASIETSAQPTAKQLRQHGGRNAQAVSFAVEARAMPADDPAAPGCGDPCPTTQSDLRRPHPCPWRPAPSAGVPPTRARHRRVLTHGSSPVFQVLDHSTNRPGRACPGHLPPAGGDRRGGCTIAGARVAGTRPARTERAYSLANPYPPTRGNTLSVNNRNERPLMGAAIRYVMPISAPKAWI